MARLKKSQTAELHDVESLDVILRRIDIIKAQVIAVREGMKVSGPEKVSVPYQPSLTSGITGLNTWTGALLAAWSASVSEVKLTHKNRVSDVSD
jgi:hypothetical protein